MLLAQDVSRVRSPAPPPPPPAGTTVYAQRGDNLADVAHRHGADEAAVREANPALAHAHALLPGQAVKLPAHDDLSPAVAGVAGAGGREGLVQALQAKAYRAGKLAPQTPFDGTVFRAVDTKFESGALDHNYGGPGRSNARGQGLIYTSPDHATMLRENEVYIDKKPHALSEKSVIEMRYTAAPDASGRGGVADIAEGARRAGLAPSTLVEHKGSKAPGWLHQLTGEHPYTLPQQAGKGASDAGASALRSPSAVGGQQIDIVSRNTAPSQLTPLSVTRHGVDGAVTSNGPAAGAVRPMPADARTYTHGPLDKRAGVRPPIDVHPDGSRSFAATNEPGKPLSAASQSLETTQDRSRADLARQRLTGAREGYPRAASTRYGAVGGAAATLIDAGVRAAHGEQVSAGQVAQATAGNAVLGGGAAKAVDALTPRLGLVKAGGAVGALVQAGVSGYSNVQAYRAGEISGSRAVANTAVDTGTAFAAGAAGAWAGAAVGSVVPVAGTAVGAVVGFGVGLGVHYAIGQLDKVTGFTSSLKDGLTSGIDAVSSGASKAWHAITPW